MKKGTNLSSKWHHYLFAILAGAFLANTLPHFINGITGKGFPTPFANPPGVGLSSPSTNMLWATINFILGVLFLILGKLHKQKWLVLLVFFISFFTMAFLLASYFGKVIGY